MYMYLTLPQVSSLSEVSVSTYIKYYLPRYIIIHVGCTVGRYFVFFQVLPFPSLPFPFLFYSVDKVHLPATYVRYLRYLFLLFLQVVLSLSLANIGLFLYIPT